MDPSGGLPPPKRIRRNSFPGSFPDDTNLQRLRQKLLQQGAPVPVTPTVSITLEKMKYADESCSGHTIYPVWNPAFKFNRALISIYDYSRVDTEDSNCFFVDGRPHRIVDSCQVPRGKILFPPYSTHAKSCAESVVVSPENCTLIPLTFASLSIKTLRYPNYCSNRPIEVLEDSLTRCVKMCCERTPLISAENYFCICPAVVVKEGGDRVPTDVSISFQLNEATSSQSKKGKLVFFLNENTSLEFISDVGQLSILDGFSGHPEALRCVPVPVLNGTNQVRVNQEVFEKHWLYNFASPLLKMGGYYFGVTAALTSIAWDSVSVNESTYRQLTTASLHPNDRMSFNVQFANITLPLADKACISLSWFKANDGEWFKAATHTSQSLNRAPVQSEAELVKVIRRELECVPLQQGRLFQVPVNYPDGSLGLMEAEVTAVFLEDSQQSQPKSEAFWGTPKTELQITLGSGIQYASHGNSEQRDIGVVERLCNKVGGVRPQARKIMLDVIYPWYLYSKKKSSMPPPAGIILYGPSGTGKTSLARELGSVIQDGKGCVRIVKGPELLDRFIGNTENNVRKLFESDSSDSIQVVIIDEMDAIFGVRHFTGFSQDRDSAISQFLTCMDGLEKAGGLLFIGTTNNIDAIDAAIKRSGRMECHYEVGLPDKASRAEILKVHCQRSGIANTLTDEDYAALAEKTSGSSGADLEKLVRKSAFKARTHGIDLDKCTAQDLDKDLDCCVELKRSHFDAVLQEADKVTVNIEAKLEQELPVSDEAFVQLECQKNAPGSTAKNVKNLIAVKGYINRASESQNGTTATVVITGAAGTGKTRLARKLVQSTQFSHLHAFNARNSIAHGGQWFSDAVQSALEACKEQKRSVIVIDNFDSFLDGRDSRPMALNALHSWADTGKVLKNRSCVLILTSRTPGLASVYSECKTARHLQLELLTPEDMKRILAGMNTCSEDIPKIVNLFSERISIGEFMDIIKPCYARDADGNIFWNLDALESDILACTEKETFSSLYS